MKFSSSANETLTRFTRLFVMPILILVLGACTSQAAREAELAAIEAERIAAELKAARIVQEEERIVQEEERIVQEEERLRAREEQRRQEAEAAERARIAAEQQRLEEEARARAEDERLRREEEERQELERLAAIATAEAEEQEKIDRIEALEQQIAAIEADTIQNEASMSILQEAILVAEELLEVLTAEQAKYENTDEQGNTVEPLSKDLIAELEARKDNLVRRAQSQ